MSSFNRNIAFYGNHFERFYRQQSRIIRKKIDWTLLFVKQTQIVPEKFLKRLINTDGLWEIRVSADKGIFRIFCFFDEGNLVVLLSGFQKKTQKTPKKEIRKAAQLKKEYFTEKRI